MNAVFLTARLKSSRLKKKVLLDVDGLPVLQYMVNRLQSNSDFKIILCTSDNSQDDDLYKFCVTNSIDCYRGSEEDVLERYYQAALNFSVEKFYIVYGDEPFTDIELMVNTFNKMNSNKLHFVDNSNCIDGTFGYGMTFKTIEHIQEKKISNNNEVWGHFVKSLPELMVIESKFSKQNLKIRLTIDYKEDLQMFKKLIRILGNRYKNCSISDIIKIYLDNNLYSINGHRIEDYNMRIEEQSIQSF